MFSHFPITRSRGFLEDGTFWLAEKFRKFSLETYPGVPVVTNPPCNAGDTGSTLGPGRFHMHGETKPMQNNYWSPCPLSPHSATREATEINSCTTTRE